MAESSQDSGAWVAWDKKYETGILMIDEQHKSLVNLCNQFRTEIMQHNRVDGMDWKTSLSFVLREAVKYTKTHFVAEERMMQQTDYPKFAQHKQRHQEFIDAVTHVLSSFNSASLQTAFEFSTFLREWILSHIAHEDKEFQKHFFDPNRKKSS